MYSYQDVSELYFTRMPQIGMITRLQFKEENSLAVILILVALSVVSPTMYGDSVIDRYYQDSKPMLQTIGWIQRTQVRLNEVMIYSWGPRQTRRGWCSSYISWNIEVACCLIGRNVQVVHICNGKPDVIYYHDIGLAPLKITSADQTNLSHHTDQPSTWAAFWCSRSGSRNKQKKQAWNNQTHLLDKSLINVRM